MPRSILKILLIAILVAPAAFAYVDSDADNTLSPFDKQGDNLKYPKPNAEENFFATRAPIPVTLRSYFGLSLGADFSTLKSVVSVTPNSTGITSQNSPFVSYGANIYGGLGTNFDKFYIGVELSGGCNTLNRSITTDNKNAIITFKQPVSAGFDLMPGYITSQKDFLFYGRLGVGAGLFNIRINHDAASAVNKFLAALRAGLGVEYFISDTFSARLEYIFTDYGKINQNYTDATSTAYTYTVSSPHSQQVNLGLTINF